MKKDKDLIMGMVVVQKPVEKKDKKNYNAMINRLINFLRAKDRPCSLSEIQREMKDIDFKSNKDFFTFLHKFDNKIKFEEKSEMFLLKSKYILANIEDLKEKIRTCDNGLLEDEELTDSYPGIRNDIERLKRENYVKVIHNEEKKCNVLFYRDIADKFEKLLTDNEYKSALTELRKIWKEDLTYYDSNEIEENFLRRKRRLTDISVNKKHKKRKVKHFQNTHIPSLIFPNVQM